MNVEANKICGRLLSQLRKEAGITQAELAGLLSVPQSFVSKVETGERSLKVYELFAYAKALHIDVCHVVTKLSSALDNEGF